MAAIAKDNERLLDMLVREIGEEAAIDARLKSHFGQRDQLLAELATVPEVSNVVLHSTAIEHLADKLDGPGKDWLHSPRAMRELVIDELNEMGESGPIVRDRVNHPVP